MRVASAVFCLCMFIMIQMVDRPNTTPIGQERESLTFKALLYLNVTVHPQIWRLFCVVYMPLFSLVKARPWFRSSMWISSVAGISKILCTSEAASTTRPHMGMYFICNVRHSAALNKLLVVCTLMTDRKCLVSVGYKSYQWRNVLSHPNLFEARPRYFVFL